MNARVLITCRQMQDCLDSYRERFDERDIELVVPHVVQQLSEDELIELIENVDGVIAGDDPFSARVIAGAPSLRVISKWGVGTDSIDHEAARARGIAVTNTPGVFGQEVADLALGYVIGLARQLHRIDASVRAEGWLKVRGHTLAGNTLGVVGFGDIGHNVARRALAFDMDVLGQDLTDAAETTAGRLSVRLMPLEELLAASAFVVLCCPLTSATHYLLDAQTLALLPWGAYIVNVSRGPLIEEAALVDALDSGQVAAAALDVFETEPLPPTSRLREFEQCILGSHNGSNTHEGVMRASERAVANLFEALET